jgi:hypothetical protein
MPASSSSGGVPSTSFRWHLSASARDVYFMQQLGELTVCASNKEELLNTHIESTQELIADQGMSD